MHVGQAVTLHAPVMACHWGLWPNLERQALCLQWQCHTPCSYLWHFSNELMTALLADWGRLEAAHQKMYAIRLLAYYKICTAILRYLSYKMHTYAIITYMFCSCNRCVECWLVQPCLWTWFHVVMMTKSVMILVVRAQIWPGHGRPLLRFDVGLNYTNSLLGFVHNVCVQ